MLRNSGNRLGIHVLRLTTVTDFPDLFRGRGSGRGSRGGFRDFGDRTAFSAAGEKSDEGGGKEDDERGTAGHGFKGKRHRRQCKHERDHWTVIFLAGDWLASAAPASPGGLD